MKFSDYIERRVIEEAHYLIDTDKNLMDISAEFNHVVSNVHTDLNVRLPQIDIELYIKVRTVINRHKLANQTRFVELSKKSRQL